MVSVLMMAGRLKTKIICWFQALVSDFGFLTSVPSRNGSLAVWLGRSSLHKDALCRVPPSVYKKAKQSGEARREGIMIVELETILRKEGLTASASRDGMVLKLQ